VLCAGRKDPGGVEHDCLIGGEGAEREQEEGGDTRRQRAGGTESKWKVEVERRGAEGPERVPKRGRICDVRLPIFDWGEGAAVDGNGRRGGIENRQWRSEK
jgi:hypothetical protein